MLNKKSALPHSENSNHLNMETTLDGKTVLQFAEECPICTEKYYEKAVINSCKHVFCFSCVLTWAEQENSCPLCKTKFTVLKKMMRMQGEDANPKEVQATIKRIAHKKQRPPEMTFAEFEQFQFDIEMNELDEWIIDDEYYSEAMDVAPVDHLEVLEESLAEMTRYNHRERRHRNNNQTAHRKTKRRKPQSPEKREDIGPTRKRYTRHIHNNNNNSDGEETPTQSIDITGEVTVEPPKSKYNLRETRTVKGLPTDFIELTNEDIEEKEQKGEDTIVSVTVVNDGCHVDRRSIVSTPTKIVKATELNLPVDQFDNKPGEHDNNDGLSEDEVVEGEGACIEHNFIDDMDINYIQTKDQNVHEGQNNSEKNVVVPQFTLTDIPFTDDDADKVMPIEGATDLQSVNNVSINNEVPLDSKPSADQSNSDDSNSLLKPPSKPQPPFPSAKKTPMLAKPLPELEDDQKPSPAPAKSAKAKRRSKSVTPVDPTPAQKPPTTAKPIDSATALTPPMSTKPPKKAAKPVTRPNPAQKPPMTTKPAVNTTIAPKPSTIAKPLKKTAKPTVATTPAAVTTPKSPPTQPVDPTPIPKSPTTADPVADTATALKPPPKPQLPALPARPPKFLSEPATTKPASTKTKIIELATSDPLIGPKGQILSKFNQSLPAPGVPASEESVSEPKAAESGENQANGTTYKRKSLAGRKGRRSSKQSSAPSDEKPQPSPKLIATDSPKVVQNNGIDLQRLNKISFKKKSTVVQPANDPVPQSTEQTADSASNNNNMIIEPNVDSTSSAGNNNIVLKPTVNVAPNNTSDNNATDSSIISTGIVKDQSAASNVRSTNTSENSMESKPLAPSSEAEAAPVTVASVTDGISNLLEKIAPVMSMDFEGYQQHGSFARDEVDFNDNELMTDDAPSQQQHFDSQERDRNEGYYNEQDHYEYGDRREYNNNHSYQANYYERQSRPKNNERRSNYSTATDNKGYNQYRDGPRDGQHHNRNSQFIGHYDNEIRPQGYFQNGRGSRQHHNGGRYGGSNRPYDRSNYNGPYPRQPYDNRAPYTAPREVPIALHGPPLPPPPALQHSFPLPVQQAVPVQVLPQQVVQQVVSVQQVPTVPMPVAVVVKSAPEEESKQDDSFYRARNKRKQKTPEPETSTVPARVDMQTQVAVKTEVTAVPIKTEVPSTAPPVLPAPPQPRALTPPTSTTSTSVRESNISAQPRPQVDVLSLSAVVVSRKRSRSRSPVDDTKQKRRKVVHEMLDLRADKRREEDEDRPSVRDKHDRTYQDKRGDQEKPYGKETDKDNDEEKYDSRYTDKYDHKNKQDRRKDKPRERSSDKDKERRSKDKDKRRDKEKDKHKDKHERRHKDKKHRDKDSTRKHKDKHRSRDKDYDKKTDEIPSSATEDEQLIECVNDPKPVGPIVVPVVLKKSMKSTVFVSNVDAKTTPIKKRKIASKVSVPQ